MKKLKLVMIGNGMAGVRTLEELIKIAPDLYDITVFGAEPHPNYNRILLSPVLAGEQTIAEIVLNPLAWYADNGITLHLGKTVTRIDRMRRVVHAADGTQAPRTAAPRTAWGRRCSSRPRSARRTWPSSASAATWAARCRPTSS